MNDFVEAYRISVTWLMRMGFTDREAQNLASLRLAFLMYPQAFM